MPVIKNTVEAANKDPNKRQLKSKGLNAEEELALMQKEKVRRRQALAMILGATAITQSTLNNYDK